MTASESPPAAALDGSGEVSVYTYEFDTALPAKIKAIQEKVASSRSAAEAAELDKYHKDGVKQIANVKIPQSAVYAVAFRPGGKILAVGGIGREDPISSTLRMAHCIKEFAPVTVKPRSGAQHAVADLMPPKQDEAVENETLPSGASLVSLEVQPKEVLLNGRFTYNQLLVTGKLASGETIDVTRMVEPNISAEIAEVSRAGLVRAKKGWEGDARR